MMTTSKPLSPQDLKKISDEAEEALIKDHERRKQKEDTEQKELLEAFMSRDIHPQVMDRINNAVRNAAQRGSNELQAFSFPASYCNDRGRRINNNETDWPDSLEGFAKRAYEFYVKELQPLGYKLRVQVLDYPGGMPGTVAFFLVW
jgi:hypothetical protein